MPLPHRSSGARLPQSRRASERDLRGPARATRGVASYSLAEGALHIGIGDFDTAAAIPDLDIFGTDPYWFLLGVDPEAFMRTYSEEAAASARKHNREFQLWLQAFRLPAGREEELRMGVRVAEDIGATHFAAWAFRATEPMSQLACGNSDRVWEIVGEEFRRVRARPRPDPQ